MCTCSFRYISHNAPDIYDVISCMLSDSICISPVLSYIHIQSQTIPEEDTVLASSQGDHNTSQLAEFRYVSAPMYSLSGEGILRY